MLAGVVVAFAVWSLWLFFGELRVDRSTSHAWIEAEGRARPIQAHVAGKIAHGSLELGRRVEEGELLVQLDDTAEQLRRAEELAHRDVLRDELEMARAELEGEREILEHLAAFAAAAKSTARTAKRTAEELARLTEEETRRIRRLDELSVIAELSALEQEAKHERAMGEASLRGAELRQSEASLRVELEERRARIKRLAHGLARLEAKIRLSDLTIARLDHEIERYRIRAPTSGLVAELTAVGDGGLVAASQHLGTVVPEGSLRAVAELLPSEAVGLVKVGQPARLRLDAHPWMHEGTIEGTVTAVAWVPTHDRIRVEIGIERSAVPLHHGLTAVAEIHVDTTTPFLLVMRAAGDLLSEHTTFDPGDHAAAAPREDG